MSLDFEPIPKRFMVWDKEKQEFISYDSNFCFMRDEDNRLCLCDIDWWAKDLVELDSNRYVVCQSTNLFDKDGKEIFEGSIVMYNHSTYFVRQDRYNGMWLLKNIKTGDCSESINGWENGKDERLKLLGHILSNPELVERK